MRCLRLCQGCPTTCCWYQFAHGEREAATILTVQQDGGGREDWLGFEIRVLANALLAIKGAITIIKMKVSTVSKIS